MGSHFHLLIRVPGAGCWLFGDGVAIGSRGFIKELFGLRRECFGPKRKDGARPIREAETDLFSLRAPRVQGVE